MRPGLVHLDFVPESCSGVAVSPTHVLTSQHQLNRATRAVVDHGLPGVVVAVHSSADLAVVAVKFAQPAWQPQTYGAAQPPAGVPVTLAGTAASAWETMAVANAPPGGPGGTFVVATQELGGRWVPCHGDSGGPAWLGADVIGVCSAPVHHHPGCANDEMTYTFIDPGLAQWVDKAKTLPFPPDIDEIPALLLMRSFSDVEQGHAVADVAGRLGVSGPTFAAWHAQYGGLDVRDFHVLRALEAESIRLKMHVARLTLENRQLRDALHRPR